MRRQIFILFLALSLLLSACGSDGGASSSSSASSPPAEDHSDSVSLPPEEPAAPLTLAAYPSAQLSPGPLREQGQPHSGPSDVRGALRCGQPVPGRPSSVRELHGQRESAHLDLHTPVRSDLLRRHSPHRGGGGPGPPDGAGPRLPVRRPPVRRPVHPGRGGTGHPHPQPAKQLLASPAGHPPRPGDRGRAPWAPVPICLPTAAGSLSLTARPGWWGDSGSLPVREIRLASLTKPDELVSAFNSGEVSLIDVDLTGTSELGSSGSYQVWDYPSTDLLYLGFNASQGLCRDPAVRRSIARAIDRDALAETIFARTRRRRPSRSTPSLPFIMRSWPSGCPMTRPSSPAWS